MLAAWRLLRLGCRRGAQLLLPMRALLLHRVLADGRDVANVDRVYPVQAEFLPANVADALIAFAITVDGDNLVAAEAD